MKTNDVLVKTTTINGNKKLEKIEFGYEFGHSSVEDYNNDDTPYAWSSCGNARYDLILTEDEYFEMLEDWQDKINDGDIDEDNCVWRIAHDLYCAIDDTVGGCRDDRKLVDDFAAQIAKLLDFEVEDNEEAPNVAVRYSEVGSKIKIESIEFNGGKTTASDKVVVVLDEDEYKEALRKWQGQIEDGTISKDDYRTGIGFDLMVYICEVMGFCTEGLEVCEKFADDIAKDLRF